MVVKAILRHLHGHARMYLHVDLLTPPGSSAVHTDVQTPQGETLWHAGFSERVLEPLSEQHLLICVPTPGVGPLCPAWLFFQVSPIHPAHLVCQLRSPLLHLITGHLTSL